MMAAGGVLSKDFCTLTAFEPSDLTEILKFVKFEAYSGSIGFAPNTLRRAGMYIEFEFMLIIVFVFVEKSYYLYSVHSSLSDAVLVGELTQNSIQINESAIQFVDGAVPVSSTRF